MLFLLGTGLWTIAGRCTALLLLLLALALAAVYLTPRKLHVLLHAGPNLRTLVLALPVLPAAADCSARLGRSVPPMLRTLGHGVRFVLLAPLELVLAPGCLAASALAAACSAGSTAAYFAAMRWAMPPGPRPRTTGLLILNGILAVTCAPCVIIALMAWRPTARAVEALCGGLGVARLQVAILFGGLLAVLAVAVRASARSGAAMTDAEAELLLSSAVAVVPVALVLSSLAVLAVRAAVAHPP